MRQTAQVVHVDRSRGVTPCILMSLGVSKEGGKAVCVTALVGRGGGAEWMTSTAHGHYHSRRSGTTGCQVLCIRWNYRGSDRYAKDHEYILDREGRVGESPNGLRFVVLLKGAFPADCPSANILKNTRVAAFCGS